MQTSGKSMMRVAVLAALLLTLFCTQAMAATLKAGSKGSAVSELQRNLKDKGYFTAKVITSRYTSSLKKAVGVFQIANSIRPKGGYGVADEQTQLKAASPDAVTYPQYVEKLTDAQLKPGGSGTYVKKAQSRLKKLGYYSGKLDSKYRSTTTAAVQDFERANGLSVDGIADKATRDVLYSDGAKSRTQYDAENYLTPLSVGSKNTTQVTQLQERLTALGYYWGEPTGVFDAQTKYSVKFFQEANGFSASGSANRTVRALVNKDTAKSFDQCVTDAVKRQQLAPGCKGGVRVAVLQLQLKNLGYYKGVITGAYTGAVTTAVRTFQTFNNMSSKYVTGKANTATRELLLSDKAIAYETVNGSDTLKSGSKNSGAVKALQSRLKELGYYTGSVDGVYSRAVVSAVKLFQKYNGLYQSGIAYSNTLALLNSGSVVAYTNAKIEKLIDVAENKLGTKYGTKSGQFDCSTFTAYCLDKVGIDVTSEVQAQGRAMLNIGKKISSYKELRRGDMVYFWSPDRKKKPGHAGIFIGKKGSQYQFIHASSSYGKVTVSDLNTNYYLGSNGAFLYGVRIWE